MNMMKLMYTAGLLLMFGVTKVKAQNIYPNFPEKFDTNYTKDEYKDTDVELKTGTWRLKGVKLISKNKGIESDGTKGLQFVSNNKRPMVAEMKFDLLEGASKITVLSSSFGADASCKWRLQSSVDGGKTWKWVGKEILVDNKQPRIEEIDMDINGTVRFRILKQALGSSKDDAAIQNGRLVIDNIAVYKK